MDEDLYSKDLIDLPPKGKASFALFLIADACTSAMAFNAIVAKLFWFVEVTGSNADNATAWRETFGVEDA